MTINPRVESILKAQSIGVSIKGIHNFEISNLNDVDLTDVDFPEKLRLGKQIEKIISALISASSNYEIVEENVQVIDGKITIGELDFIIKHKNSDTIFHLELVYKFYLYDPKHSVIEMEKWIGPNRKDSFIEKYTKLVNKQFPLLFREETKPYLTNLNVNNLSQQLCFMASLFVPHHLLGQKFGLVNQNSIIGYWLTMNDFKVNGAEDSMFYLPTKHEWGIDPKHNLSWVSFSTILNEILDAHSRQFSPLCWIKKPNGKHEQCFIVWW